jgi:hypothetical protein
VCGCVNWTPTISRWKVIPAQSLNLQWRTENCVRSGARDPLRLTVTPDSHFCFVPFFLWINISNISDLFSESRRSEDFSCTKSIEIMSTVNRP